MKLKIYLSLFLLSISFSVWSGNLTEAADSAYMKENYAEAIDLYNKAISEDGVSSTLYYNLGNAYYRNGQKGKAILNYSRALRLDPANEDAAINLEFVKTKIVDKQEDNLSLIEKVDNNIVTFTSADNWAIFSIVIFTLLLLCVAGYIFMNEVKFRKISFFTAIILFAILIFSLIYTFKSAKRVVSNNGAIIIVESVQLGTSPRVPKDKSEQAFFLHEGTRLEIVDSLRNNSDVENPLWYEVKVDNLHRAWISAKNVEKI